MNLKAEMRHLGFSELVKLAAEHTTKTADEFLHYRAQSAIGAIAKVTKQPGNRTKADAAEKDAMAHLTGAKSPKGLRIRPSAKERARSIMNSYQNEMEHKYMKILKGGRGADYLYQHKRMKGAKYLKTIIEDDYEMRVIEALSNRLMLRLNRRGNLRKDAFGRYYLENTLRNLKTKPLLNVSQIAARNEIKQRRRSGGALHASFAILYKELLKYKLGEAVRGKVSFPKGSTWEYRFDFDREKKEFKMMLSNAGFKDPKPVRIVSDGIKSEERQMRRYLERKLSDGFNKNK